MADGTDTPEQTRAVLTRAAEHALAWREGLDDRHVAPTTGWEELRERLGGSLPEGGSDPVEVVDRLVAGVEGGLLASGGPRFFGWVIGGCHPVALAADWLVGAWDQNAPLVATSPAAAVTEEISGGWLKEILGLPAEASFAFVTGCQMAHVTALAAARHRLLAERGFDVNRRGLWDAPPLRVVAGPHRHESLLRALRYLGIGTDRVRTVPLDGDGRMEMDALERELDRPDDPAEAGAPTVVCLMAGDLSTGAADPFPEACALARARGAWVHVDGAFGLWMNASATGRALLEGVEAADSWATDGHKWLQLPFDHGFVFVRDAEAHRAAMAIDADYLLTPPDGPRNPMHFTPEWSRRARGVATWAVLRTLGREGVARIVDRCCRLADRLVREIGSLPGAEVLSPARMNQGLVRFRAAGREEEIHPEHDRRTEAVMEAVRRGGVAWFGGTTWRGMRAMRISVSGHRTGDADVDRTVEAVRDAVERTG